MTTKIVPAHSDSFVSSEKKSTAFSAPDGSVSTQTASTCHGSSGGGQSFASAVFNTMLTAVGIGVLGIPKAMAKSGYILGFSMIVGCGAVDLVLSQLLNQCLLLLPPEFKYTVRRYEDLGDACFGQPGKVVVSLALHSALVGSGAILLLLLGSNTHELVPALSQTGWVLVWTAAMMPLALLRTMKQVGWLSGTVGLFSVFAVLISVIVVSAVSTIENQDVLRYDPTPAGNNASEVIWGIGTVFANLTFAYAVNCTMPTIILDMKDRSQAPRMISLSFVLMIALYLAIAVSGYFGYGEDLLLGDTIVDAMIYLDGDTITWGSGIVLVSVLLICATHYVVMLNPSCRELEHLIGYENPTTTRQLLVASLIRCALVGFTALLAIFVPKFEALVDLLGSVSFSCLHLVFPCVFWLKLRAMKGHSVTAVTASGLGMTCFCSVVLGVSVVGMVIGIRNAVANLSD